MCGIVGVFGDMTQDRLDAFADLLQCSVLRGADSTGVFSVNKKHVQVLKDVLLPTQLIETTKYDKVAGNLNIHCLIGHTRAATKGEVSRKYAHPFVKKHIILVHNGTLWSQTDLPDHKDFESDSENIAHSIAEQGIDETWPNISGAATLVYYDVRSGSLNIISNGKRPLSWGLTQNKKAIILASESWMIYGCCSRNTVPIFEHKLHVPQDNILYSFKWNHKKQELIAEERRIPHYKPFVRTDPWAKDYDDYGDGLGLYGAAYYNRGVSSLAERDARISRLRNARVERGNTDVPDANVIRLPFGNPNLSNAPEIIEVESEEVVDDSPYLEPDLNQRNKPADKVMTEAQFRSQYGNGCLLCGFDIGADYDTAVVLDKATALCETCFETACSAGMYDSIRNNAIR